MTGMADCNFALCALCYTNVSSQQFLGNCSVFSHYKSDGCSAVLSQKP